MSEPIAKQVLSIIETAPNDTIFASVDFSSLAIGDTIRKTLNRLEEQQVLVKLLPSIYKPVFDSYTQIKTAQSIDTTGVALF